MLSLFGLGLLLRMGKMIGLGIFLGVYKNLLWWFIKFFLMGLCMVRYFRFMVVLLLFKISIVFFILNWFLFLNLDE